jgi:peptidoglycan L-alanyl-D-glutamate endopeptidase CwlK
MIDPRSAKVIATLLLKVQPTFANLLIELKKHYQEKGLEVKYISGTRTYAEQDAIYAQGRTKPGPIRTKARGGESNHNFGIAVDVGLFLPDGRYLEDSPFYRDIGKIVATFPTLEWGGDWKFVDEPHIQWRTGLTLAEMRERVKAGKAVV